MLAACGSGGGEAGSGGNYGPPGNGGGPAGPGGTGSPLSIPLEFTLRNDSSLPRTETIRASVPFPEGAYTDLGNVVVSGHQTAWRPLQNWPDGSVRVAQAQFTDTVQPGQQKTYSVARDVPALSGPFQQNGWVSQLGPNMLFGAEVEDGFGVKYRSFAAGGGEVLQESPLVKVRRHRTYHDVFGGGAGIGRDFLTSTYYVTEFRDMPVVLVDWVLGNDYLGRDNVSPTDPDRNLHPLGGVDLDRASFIFKGVTGVQCYRGVQQLIAPPVGYDNGYLGFEVLKDTFIYDAQTRRYRFVLYLEHPTAAQVDRDRWRATAAAIVDHPILPLATHATWYATEGAGLLGGPVAGPADSWSRAEGEFQSWNNANHFGFWGSFGDAIKTGTTGTPRNHALSPELAHAIQANHHRLLVKLEQKAWAQAMRPYHLWNLYCGATQNLLLWDGVPIYPGSRDLSHESLGRRALWANDPYPQYRTRMVTGGGRAHGWEHFDHEHWSTDLLFDYWTISGDEWAKSELRQLGQSLKSLMRLQTYSTQYCQAVRAEGWTMQGFAQVYVATGDASIKDYALRRLNENIDPGRNTGHASRALQFQSNYIGTRFPLNHRFFMPWQHGALLYGYLGAWKFFQDPLLMEVCEDVVTTVEYSWLSNYSDPNLGLVSEGLRYYVPVEHNGTPIPANYWDNDPAIGVRWGDSPLGGAHTFLIGGLHRLAAWSPDPGIRQRALQKARLLMPDLTEDRRWDKWKFTVTHWYQ